MLFRSRLVIRGDMGSNSFMAFYLKDGVVISADAVNRAPDFGFAKRMVGERMQIAAETLAAKGVPASSANPPPPSGDKVKAELSGLDLALAINRSRYSQNS